MLPGVYSVIVPLPSVVVVVVVVSETCAHAKGAATAKTILSNSFFIVFSLLLFSAGERFRLTRFLRDRKVGPRPDMLFSGTDYRPVACLADVLMVTNLR